MEQDTLMLIKPDVTKANKIGEVISIVERDGFKIVDMKYAFLSEDLLKIFYQEHEGKEHFVKNIRFMHSGPIVVVLLRRDNAITRLRTIIGCTDPFFAEVGTIRKQYGSALPANAVHASDSDESAYREISLFFGMYNNT